MTSTKIKSQKITEGTKEWADSNVNIYNGCSNNCRYCYAKKMAIRFKRKTKDTWKIMELKEKKVNKGYQKREGRVMFPTSHDITESSLKNCIIVLGKLLEAENEILVTTKPKLSCIKEICKEFLKKKELLQFRFTITSTSNRNLEFWEPGAPSFEERFNALKYAYNENFKTSVSIEPFLDKDPFLVVEKVKPYTSESIWIGKMNYIKASDIPPSHKKYYTRLRNYVDKKNLKLILKKASEYDPSFLRLKDSIYYALDIR